MVSSSLMTYFSAMWHIWINCNGTHNLQKKNSANAIVEIPQVIWGYNLNRKQMISWIEYDHDSRIMVHICGTRVTSKQYLLSNSCGGKCPWRQAVCTWNRARWRFTYDPLLCLSFGLWWFSITCFSIKGPEKSVNAFCSPKKRPHDDGIVISTFFTRHHIRD